MCDEEIMMSFTLIVRSTEKNKPRNALKSLGDGRDAYEIESVKWNFSIETERMLQFKQSSAISDMLQ